VLLRRTLCVELGLARDPEHAVMQPPAPPALRLARGSGIIHRGRLSRCLDVRLDVSLGLSAVIA
jgi:hypothetical protein